MQLIKSRHFILFFFIIYFITNSISYGNSTVAIIDINYILKNSKAGKELILELEEINLNNIKNLNYEETKLKEQEIRIKQLQNVASQKEINQNIDLFKEDIKKFKELKESLTKTYNEAKNQNLDQFIKDIRPTLENYMKKNSISLLIDKRNIFIAQSETDITNEILQILNKDKN